MAQAFITRSVQLTQEDWQMVEDFKHEHQLRSWSKAFVAMIAMCRAMQVQEKGKKR